MATILPETPVTCGIAASGGVNPARAQVGSDDTGGCPTHPFEAALRLGWPALARAELPALARVELAPARAEATVPETREADCSLCPVHAARRDAAAITGTRRTRCLMPGHYARLRDSARPVASGSGMDVEVTVAPATA